MFNFRKAFSLVVFSCILSSVQAQNPDLVAYYPFNGNANDESGNGNNGSVNGAILTKDRFGQNEQSYEFDGDGDFINVPFDPSLYPESISISVWLKMRSYPDAGRTSFVLSNAGSGGNPPYDPYTIFIDENGLLTGKFNGNNDTEHVFLNSNNNIQLDVWCHVVSVFDDDGNIAKLYIDNIINDAESSSMVLDENALGIHIGSDQYLDGEPSPNRFFSGIIDDIRIYNYSLSEDEISELYHENGWQGNPQNSEPVAYYPFNGNANDESGNGNNGSIEGATFTSDRFGNPDEAIYFDGIDDYVRIDHSEELSPSEEMSISVFVKIDNLSQDHGKILSKKNYGGYSLDINRPNGQMFGQFAFQSGDAEVRFDNSLMTEGDWHHLVLTYDGEYVRYYLDATEQVSLSKTGSLYTNTECLLLAAEVEENCTIYNDQFGELAMDDLRIFNTALTQSEIESLYHENGWDSQVEVGTSVAFGPFTFYADDIQMAGDSKYTLQGNINLENIVEFDGNLTIDTNALSMSGDGKVFLTSIPEFEEITMYEGGYSFQLTGEDNRTIDVAELLGDYSEFKVADLSVSLETMELLDDGVRIDGKMVMPPFFPNTEIEINTLQITKSQGLGFASVVTIDELDIMKGKASLKDVELDYSSIDRVFRGTATLETKLAKIGAETEFIEGKVNSIGVLVEIGKPVPLGSTGLGLAGGNGAIRGIQNPPTSLSMGVDIVPLAPGPLSDAVRLNDLTLTYTFGERKFEGTGELEVFNRGLADAYLRAQRRKVEFGGRVNFAEVLLGEANLGISKTDEELLLNGNADASLQIPGGDGFPFDIVEAIVGELPYVVGYTSNTIANDGIRGSTDIKAFNMDYALLWENGDLNTSFAINLNPLNLQLFPTSRLESGYAKASSLNRFEGQSLLINPDNDFYNDKRKSNSVLDTFTLDSPPPVIVVRLEGISGAPDFSLISPDQESITPTNVGEYSNVDFYSNTEENKSFYIIKSPETGQWTVESPDDGSYQLDIFGANTPPSINFEIGSAQSKRMKKLKTTAQSLDITWSAYDPDSDALIAFYYDDNNLDQNGVLIEGNIDENKGSGSISWDISELTTGSYFVYAKIDDGESSPRFVYADKEVLISSEGAPNPPTDLVASVLDSVVQVSWVKPGLENSYQIYYSSTGEVGYNSRFFSVNDTSSIIVDSLFIPGNTYTLAVSTVDTAGLESILSDTTSFTFISESRNNQPFIARVEGPNQVISDNEFLAQIIASDGDGDVLSYALKGHPGGMNISSEGIIRWAPANDNVGNYRFKAIASDQISSDSVYISVTVVDSVTSIGALTFLTTTFNELDVPYGLTLRDINLNTNPSLIDSATITLTTRDFSPGLNFFLYETNANTGVFEGTIELSDDVTDIYQGIIAANDIDTLYAVYEDAFPEGKRIATAYLNTQVVANEEESNSDQIPAEFDLSQNYPNPFNPSTTIRFSIPKPANVELFVINTIGQKVATLVNEQKTAGNYSVQFDASRFSSGVYFYVLKTGDFQMTRKMLLIK